MVAGTLRDCHNFDQTILTGTCRAETWEEGLHEQDGKGAGQEIHLRGPISVGYTFITVCEYIIIFLFSPLSYEMRTKNNKQKVLTESSCGTSCPQCCGNVATTSTWYDSATWRDSCH
jgi:hypothetical protein